MNITGKSLLVFGSRTLNDARVEAALDEFVADTDYKYIVTALDPFGVCERVKHFAKASRLGLVLIQVGLDSSHGRGMHERRSKIALEMADYMLAIWDGESSGTAGEIKLAKKMKVPFTVIIMKPMQKLVSVEFDLPEMKSDW
jgi:hypothetical protein